MQRRGEGMGPFPFLIHDLRRTGAEIAPRLGKQLPQILKGVVDQIAGELGDVLRLDKRVLFDILEAGPLPVVEEFCNVSFYVGTNIFSWGIFAYVVYYELYEVVHCDLLSLFFSGTSRSA